MAWKNRQKLERKVIFTKTVPPYLDKRPSFRDFCLNLYLYSYDFSSKYRLFRIKGLLSDIEGYYQSRQFIIRSLSYLLKSPVTIIDQNDTSHLVVRDDITELPSPYPVIKSSVQFEGGSEVFELDYTLRSPQNDEICLRFLQFMLQAPLRNSSELWQPGTGQPFFLREPVFATSTLGRYEGFSVRAIITHDGRIGFCVDVTSKFVSRQPLPTHLSRNEFPRWKNQSCIYHYGHQWYDIQIEALSDFDVLNHMVPGDGGELKPLLDVIVKGSEKPIPPELANLLHDTSVVLYKNNRGDQRAAPTALCFPVYGSDDLTVSRHHQYTILKPSLRRDKILNFVSRYLRRLKFGDLELRVDGRPIKVACKRFPLPDLEFGNSAILSTCGTESAYQVDLTELGKARLNLLQQQGVGFYEKTPLDRQYFIIPRSVYDSYGTYFLEGLAGVVDSLFPQKDCYEPEIIIYDDRGPKTYIGQGVAILNALNEKERRPGFGVVMIHHIDRNIREEDPLEAMVIRELRQQSIVVSVIHSAVGQECYQLMRDINGRPCYAPIREKRGKLRGYLRNVAINKVLLNDSKWPFVLATPLHADVVIGIDVKNNTAGLLVVGNKGSRIGLRLKTSKQKEKLITKQIRSYLVEILREELMTLIRPVLKIVIHRDGQTYETERKGAEQAINQLKTEGLLDPNATLTIVDIPKTSPVRIRLFDVSGGRAQNPQVGDYYINGNDGYLCSTGRAFLDNGTVQPLHVRRVYGPMPIEDCLEDIYCLTVLSWTRPEGCIRNPITIKLIDRFLREEATEYDAELLEYELSTRMEEDI